MGAPRHRRRAFPGTRAPGGEPRVRFPEPDPLAARDRAGRAGPLRLRGGPGPARPGMAEAGLGYAPDREGSRSFLHGKAHRATTGAGGDSMNGTGVKEKAAIVTGSTKGIGRAIAEALLQEGARVVISARNEAEVAQAGKELERAHPKRVLARHCDVRR